MALITCSGTWDRQAYPTRQEDDIQILDAGDYAGELEFTPYIVSAQRIEGFISGEHAEEFRRGKPEGFDIPAGAILAVGDSVRITLDEGGSPYSVMDLVNAPNIETGSFQVSLDDNRIKIHMAPGDKDRIEALRQRGERSAEMAALFPAVYLHAVIEALRNLPEHPDSQWAGTMRQALENHNISVDDEELKSNALKYAQTLMDKPIGTFLTAFIDRAEE